MIAAKPVKNKEKNKFQGKRVLYGEAGHKTFFCRKMKKRYGETQVVTVHVNRNIGLVLSQKERNNRKAESSFIDWTLDSGARPHTAFNEDHFQDLREFDEPLVIESTKEGKKLTAVKKDTVKERLP